MPTLVAVVGDETDLLVLLTHHLKEDISDIWFRSEAKRSVEKSTELPAAPISIRSLQRKFGSTVCQQLLVVHTFGGCDTTLAIFGHGKGKILERIVGIEASLGDTEVL